MLPAVLRNVGRRLYPDDPEKAEIASVLERLLVLIDVENVARETALRFERANSLDLSEFCLGIQGTLGVSLGDGDLTVTGTFDDLVNRVQKKKALRRDTL